MRDDLRRPLRRLVDAGNMIKLDTGVATDPNTRYRLAKYGPWS